MISKQEFIKYIKFLKEIDSRELKFQKSLEECFGKENVGHFFAFNFIMPTIVEMLCKLLDIEPNLEDNFCDDLHYFIYELDYGDAKGANEAIETYGKTWDLSSPEKFYDYLCAMKQLDQIIS